LFENENNLPYLQALIDKSSEIKNDISNDISNFLRWWDEKGKIHSVNVNDNSNAIKLMTVHKAKGLEFKAVLIPFFDWPVTWPSSLPPVLLCQTDKEPYNRFRFLPLKAEKSFEDSYFKNVYFEEKADYATDTLNLIYVAFTRAKTALIVNCQVSKADEKSNAKENIRHLFFRAVDRNSSEFDSRKETESGMMIFEKGKIGFQPTENKKSKEEKILKYKYKPYNERLSILVTGDELPLEPDQTLNARNFGKIIHEILSMIKTKSDLSGACEKVFCNGAVNEDNKKAIIEKIANMLASEKASDWFSEKYKVLNERSLMTPDNMYRPDRIMLAGDKAVVIDFKTGEFHSEKHTEQVMKYAQTILNSGIASVEGYLWYIHSNFIEKVC
jgi:ATP-dependent exoDNAse (exonuclease V) beta subunit